MYFQIKLSNSTYVFKTVFHSHHYALLANPSEHFVHCFIFYLISDIFASYIILYYSLVFTYVANNNNANFGLITIESRSFSYLCISFYSIYKIFKFFVVCKKVYFLDSGCKIIVQLGILAKKLILRRVLKLSRTT